MRTKETVKCSYVTFALLLEELLSGPSTAKTLAEHTGMGHRYMCRLLRTLYDKGVIHVAGWERDAIGRMGVAVYALGHGKDAKKPLKSRTQIQRDWRKKNAAAPIASTLAGTPWAGLPVANDSARKAA